jgi:hypothetical protein
MKVSGFTIVRNVVKYSYPVVESILSVLPLCDEFIVSIGNSEDDTLSLINSINSEKIRIIHSTWDDSLREGGRVLAIETNKALAQISPDSDWCFYIQADEVMHEKYIEPVFMAMTKCIDDLEVEGLLFKYLHFYGTYDYTGDSRRWYRNEIRVIRNEKEIRSYKDAQGFRKNDKKLRVKPIDAFIYHYGWVKHPAAMQGKIQNFHKMWHSDEWITQNVKQEEQFDYSEIDSLKKFTGSHPGVMKKRIDDMNWHLDLDISNKKLGVKDKMLLWLERSTGFRPFEYKNYRIT